METTNFYLVILLAGILIGGIVVGVLVIGLIRPPAPGYPPQYYAPPPAYPPPQPTGPGMFLLLLAIGLLGLLALHHQQAQRRTMPIAREIPVEGSYSDDLPVYQEWGN